MDSQNEAQFWWPHHHMNRRGWQPWPSHTSLLYYALCMLCLKLMHVIGVNALRWFDANEYLCREISKEKRLMPMWQWSRGQLRSENYNTGGYLGMAKCINCQNGTVEQITKMPLMIFWPKDRPKIQDPKKIQDTNDMVETRDTGGMANEDTC